MNLKVNGERREVERAATIADLIADLGHDARGTGVAIALNGEVVRRAEWGSTALHEQDRVEVLGAAQGG
ncbi:MAG: sulfur carrier protein ThiS [Actinomycetota bacterium]